MTEILLRDGTTTQDPRLDRLVLFDEQSRQYPVRAVIRGGGPAVPRSRSWAIRQTLDQGEEGRCVEFSTCHEMLAAPTKVDPAKVDVILRDLSIYHPAQHDDPWDGCYLGPRCPIQPSPNAYEGTAVLSGVKRAAALGFYAEYRWAFGLEDAVLGLQRGPAIMGLAWLRGMFRPDERGFIHATGDIMGGHAILCRAVRIVWINKASRASMADVDLDRSYVTFRNSWGRSFGKGGDCYLSLRDLATLLAMDGEVCFPTKRRSGPR